MGNPIKDTIRDFAVDRPNCPKCDAKMLSIQACHFVCPDCGGVLDCSDTASGG